MKQTLLKKCPFEYDAMCPSEHDAGIERKLQFSDKGPPLKVAPKPTHT